MSTFKRCMSLLLVLGILLGVLAPAAQAAPVDEMATVDTGAMTIEGTNGFGNLLSQEIQESQEESATAEEGYEAGYSVVDMTFDGAAATVEYSSLEEARLVVAVYSEDGLQMLASGETTVSPEEDVATVTIEGDMPEYFLASAYLVDTYDMSPLCAAYDTPMYTQEMQELLASTVDDYDPELVLNLDEDETTNFAVYADSTIVVEPVDGMNTVTSIDEENAIYVIKNADEQITSLVEGNVFAYPYAEDEILIVKIADIQVDGTTVSITGADLSMGEVFAAVKIEGDDSTENMIVDKDSVDEGMSYEGISYPMNPGLLQPMDDEVGNEISKSAKFLVDKEVNLKGGRTVNIAGSVEFSVKAEFSYYISMTRQHIEFRVDYTIAGALTITGEIGHEWRLCKAAFYPIPCLDIAIEPTFKVEVSGMIEFGATLTGTIGFTTEGKGGIKLLNTTPKFEPDVKAECTIFMGFDLKPQIEIAEGCLAELEVELPIGLELKITRTGNNGKTPSPSEPSYHTCAKCLDVESFFKVETKVTGQFLKCKWLKMEYTPRSVKVALGHRYFSIDHVQWGRGLCPYMAHRLTVVVKDKSGTPFHKVNVYAGSESGITNVYGVAVLYLPEGNYTVKAESGDTFRAKKSIDLTQATKVTITLTNEENSESSGGFLDVVERGEIIDEVPAVSNSCGANVYWSLSSDGILTIAGSGPMDNYSSSTDVPWYSDRDSITSVIIGDDVTSIGDLAFASKNGYYLGDSLRSVTIGDSVTTIGDAAFSWCTSLTSVTIPDSVTFIGDSAFNGCTSMSNIIIGNSVTIISDDAFRSCESLSNVSIPDSVTTIGDYAFYSCDSLGSVAIGDGVTTIGDYAFEWDDNLTSVTIGDSVAAIGDYAFHRCDGLSSVVIPDSVTTIGNYAFDSCNSLNSVTIGDGVTTIGDYAFNNCDNLSNVTLGEGVTTIGDYAFYSCGNLSSVTLPDNVTTIGDYAFCGCGIKSVTIPDSVTIIGDYAFCSTDLASVTIGESVTTIGDYAFRYCLTGICVDDNNPNYSTDDRGVLFDKKKTLLIQAPGAINGSYDIPASVTNIGNYAFEYCTSLTSVIFPDSVTTICDYAFYDCDSLSSVTIGKNVTTIGECAFYDCSRLTGIYIDEKNTCYSTDDRGVLFDKNKTKLIQVLVTISGSYDIPASVTSIGDYAFSRQRGLTSVTIPNGVTSIGDYAFFTCITLKEVIFCGDAPLFGHGVFTNVVTAGFNPLTIVYYPAENATWTTSLMRSVGTDLVWKSYTLDENGNIIPNKATAITMLANLEKPLEKIQPTDFSTRNHGEEQLNPEAVYDGDYSSVVTDKYTLKIASFSGLVSGQQYILLAMSSIDVENPISADNLLYIDQAEAREDGTLVFQYVQRVPTDSSYVVACGASNKDLNDAEITFPEMEADGAIQTVNPTVVYDGKTLTEGQDYTIVGTVSFTEPGIYNCYIRGVRNYAGLVECSYTVGGTVPEVNSGTCGGDLTWSLSDNGVLTISGTGPMTDFSGLGSAPWYSRSSAITTVIIDRGVTTIGNYAFYDCRNVTSVTISDSVAAIGDYAFYVCANLDEIIFKGNAPSFGSSAFQHVAAIAYYPADDPTWIEDVKQNYGGTITWEAYTQECTEHTYEAVVTEPTCLEQGYTTYTCSKCGHSYVDSYEDALGHDFVEGICSRCGVEDPNWNAPELGGTCGDNTVWTLSENGVLRISGTGSTANYSYSSRAPWNEYADSITSVIVEEGITRIGGYSFYGCKSVTDVSLPDGLLEVGYDAFHGCQGLNTLTIPDSVTAVQTYAFYACSKLTAITIPKNVVTISSYAFANCRSVETLYFNATSMADIPENNNTFDGMSSAVGGFELVVGANVQRIPSNLLYPNFSDNANPSLITKLSFEERSECTTIGENAFRKCTYLSEVSFPDSLREIEARAFHACEGLVSLTIPEGVEIFGDYAFYYCTGLQKLVYMSPNLTIGKSPFGDIGKKSDGVDVIIGEQVETIPNSLFPETYVKTVKFSGNCRCHTIGKNAFSSVNTLTEIEIPSSVKTIGNWAFGYCRSLKKIHIDNIDAWCSIEFGDSGSNPLRYGDLYLNGELVTDIQIPDGITSVGNYAFYCYSDLSSVIIPDSVTSIGCDAFFKCTGLEEIVFPDNLTEIGERAFAHCTGLSSVVIPDRVTAIGRHAFSDCTNLTRVVIGKNVASMGVSAFYDGTSLTEIVFTGDAPEIGDSVFKNVVATAYYPADNDTWTASVKQNYGGTITWVPYEPDEHEHSYELVVTAPTCTEQGYTTFTCTCGDSYKDNYTPATGHSYNYKATKAPTTSVTGTLTGTCSKCSGTTTVTLPKLNTTDYSYKVTKEPTCTATGMCRYTWKTTAYGSFYFDVSIAAKGHTYTSQVTSPTCTEQGYTTHTCHCGDRYVSDYTDPMGHDWDDGVVTREPTEDTEGERLYTCAACGATKTESIPVIGHEHSYEAVVTAPTCTEQGYTTYTCSCGESYIENYVGALGHNFGEWVVITEPTTMEEGLEERSCTRCGHTEQRSIAKLENPDLIASGICGIDLVWQFTTDGCLTISGSGAMYDFGSFDSPWFDYREQILCVVIEDGATSIGNYAFNYCVNVTCIQIPDSVTVIGKSAFDDCNSLSDLSLPENLVSIGSHAFYSCTSLTSIVFPASVTTIGNYAFWDCESLEEIVVEDANQAYSSLDGVLYNKQQTNLIVYPAGKVGAFAIPNSVTTISDFAFYKAEEISAVTIPDHVTHIGSNAFRECKKLTTVEIPAGISTISSYAFAFCEALSQITIPSNITLIEDRAFAYCDNLTLITFEGDAPAFEEDVFLDVTAEARYPANNSTWTADTMQDYGGTISWISYQKLSFVDVSEGTFYYEPVMWAIENGITNGTSATAFGPNDQCMRAHVVTFLWRAAGSPEPKLMVNPFVDVKPSDFYYKPVLWALENGITSGMDATHFGPTAYCNRAQVVTFLYRTMGSPELESSENPFTDVAKGSFYEKPVLWAVQNGITNGLSATAFGPNAICNRAQIVTFLYRAFVNE